MMIFIIPGLILLVLSVLPLAIHPSWKKFGKCIVVSLLGVMLPLFIFFFSTFLAPDSKSQCVFGWLDCFHAGKLILTPIVIVATGALYFSELCALRGKLIARALFLGATVAGGCFMFGFMFVDHLKGMELWLLVPLYVAIWHGVRAWQMIHSSSLKPKSLLVATLSSLPFWIGSIIFSRHIFESLPADPQGCFIVTAASRGHLSLVGPHVQFIRRGVTRQANQQLATFWRFESLWHDHSPRSHALFRCAYNRLGPAIARPVSHPLAADAVYLLLKPLEFGARFVIQHHS